MAGWKYFENFAHLVLLILCIGCAYFVVRDWWINRKKKRQVSTIIQKGFSKQKGRETDVEHTKKKTESENR